MKIEIPNVKELISLILRAESNYDFEANHPSLGEVKRKQTIEKCVKAYHKQKLKNRKSKSIEIFNIFAMNILLRVIRGEKGFPIYKGMSKEFKRFKDITNNSIKAILKTARYRWGNEKGTKVVLGIKEVLCKNYQYKWEKYFEKAERNYKENFPDDPFLKISNVGFKVRDLALSCFSELYSANDVHVVRVLIRTGLLMYGYGDINIGTNAGNEKNYIFLHNLIIKLSGQSNYSPGELDRIFWHFGKNVCSAKPKCFKCPVNKICLTNQGGL